MTYAKARKHYRVGRERIRQTYRRGLFIPEDKKMTCIIVALIFIIAVFVKGLLFGYWFTREH